MDDRVGKREGVWYGDNTDHREMCGTVIIPTTGNECGTVIIPTTGKCGTVRTPIAGKCGTVRTLTTGNGTVITPTEGKRALEVLKTLSWEILGSNQRPLPCRGSALNQLS